MKITTTINLAKRVYNFVAHEASVPHVILATCKVGRLKYKFYYFYVYTAMMSVWQHYGYVTAYFVFLGYISTVKKRQKPGPVVLAAL